MMNLLREINDKIYIFNVLWNRYNYYFIFLLEIALVKVIILICHLAQSTSTYIIFSFELDSKLL